MLGRHRSSAFRRRQGLLARWDARVCPLHLSEGGAAVLRDSRLGQAGADFEFTFLHHLK